MSSETIGIFLITHNRLLGEGLTKVMSESGDICVLGAAAFSPETMEQLVTAQPDVVLADCTMDGVTGLEIVPEVHRHAPNTRVVLIGMGPDSEMFLNAVQEGVLGYVLRSASSQEVAEAVRAVARGMAVCPPEFCLTLFQVIYNGVNLPRGWRLGLTRREQVLVAMIGRGLTNKEIASELNLSEFTVKNQIHRMLRKVGVNRRLAIVELCRKSAQLVA
jgi:two-component system, NarL family, response regulator DevR